MENLSDYMNRLHTTLSNDYKTPDGKEMISTWKGFTLAKLLSIPPYHDTIRKSILKLQSEGNTILNNNLDGFLS